jgi:hypothetical protein
MGYIEYVLGERATEQPDCDQSYNGWSSYETWLFSVHDDGSLFSEYVMESWNDIKNNANEYEDEEQAARELLTRVSEYAKEMTNDLLGIDDEKNLFKKDVLLNFVNSVNWLEIASHYIDDVPQADHPLWTEQEEEEEEEEEDEED